MLYFFLYIYVNTELSPFVQIIVSQLTYFRGQKKSNFSLRPASLRFVLFSLREKLGYLCIVDRVDCKVKKKKYHTHTHTHTYTHTHTRTHTCAHTHADRGVNCQCNEWSRNVFQSRGGARTGLSSFHNHADIYAPVCLKTRPGN